MYVYVCSRVMACVCLQHNSALLPGELRGQNSGRQAWQQAPLVTEPPH